MIQLWADDEDRSIGVHHLALVFFGIVGVQVKEAGSAYRKSSGPGMEVIKRLLSSYRNSELLKPRITDQQSIASNNRTFMPPRMSYDDAVWLFQQVWPEEPRPMAILSMLSVDTLGAAIPYAGLPPARNVDERKPYLKAHLKETMHLALAAFAPNVTIANADSALDIRHFREKVDSGSLDTSVEHDRLKLTGRIIDLLAQDHRQVFAHINFPTLRLPLLPGDMQPKRFGVFTLDAVMTGEPRLACPLCPQTVLLGTLYVHAHLRSAHKLDFKQAKRVWLRCK